MSTGNSNSRYLSGRDSDTVTVLLLLPVSVLAALPMDYLARQYLDMRGRFREYGENSWQRRLTCALYRSVRSHCLVHEMLPMPRALRGWAAFWGLHMIARSKMCTDLEDGRKVEHVSWMRDPGKGSMNLPEPSGIW